MPLTPNEPLWWTIRTIFMESGFTWEEAEKAADDGLDPNPPNPEEHKLQVFMVKRLLRNRKLAVTTLMEYGGFTMEEAVEDRARQALERRIEKGLGDMDLFGGDT